MERKITVFFGLFLLIGLAGCASFGSKQPAAPVDNSAGGVPLPPYSGLKARIAVADFDVKSAKASNHISSGLREMLVTALINSNRFSVLERQALNSAARDQADLIITAAVTEFEPQASGGRGGIGGGGGVGSGVFGGLLGASLNKAHMVMDIRIVDTSTSEVLAATKVQGQASDVAGGVMAGFMGNWALGAGLSGYANTPMEKAIRICIIEAVRYLSQNIPVNYYKY